jgi:hypothetical protein
MPVCPFKHHTADKPWVTDKFRQLIRSRQYAFRVGNKVLYNKQRNTAQRLAKDLRRRYYQHRVQDLRNSNPHSWWSSVKQFIGLSGAPSSELSALCNTMFAGDLDLMANNINEFFANVASDIAPYPMTVWPI